MTLASLIGLVVKISIVLTVLGLGLRASRHEAAFLFRRPGLLLRALISMHVLMPLVAAALVSAFDLNPAVKLALVTLSVSPIPPLLPRKHLKAGGSTEYSYGLLTATALLAIVIIPVSIAVFGMVFDKSAAMPASEVAKVVFMTVLAPLAVGIFVHEVAPALAARIAKPIGLIATVLLVLGVLPVLFTAMPAFASLIGNGTLLAISAFVLLGLAAGHLLGGPEEENRAVLALSTASRHPGVAIAIARINFPEEKLAPAAILLYLLVNAVLSKPYLSWRQRQRTPGISIPPVKERHA